jgi:hypothetical protein
MALPVFSVSRAEVVDGTHVCVYFTSSVENIAQNCSPGNFIFGGGFQLVARSAVAHGDYIAVEVNQMKANMPQTVTVANVRDVLGRALRDPKLASFTGQGGSPQISYILAIDSRTIRVVFDEQVTNCPTLYNINNYTITGPYPVSVLSITRINSRIIEIATTSIPAKFEYELAIVNIFDVLNNLIDPKLGKRNFTSSDRPKLLEAEALSNPLRVRLYFDRTIVPSASFLDYDNFAITGPMPLVVTGTKMVYGDYSDGAYTVDVYYLSAQNAQYTVTVYTAIDEQGRDIDPYYNTTAFLASTGAAPLDLLMASHPGLFNILLKFNQAVEPNAALFNPSNYTITGGTIPVTVAYVIQRDPEIIYVAVNSLQNVSYTITVRNIVSAYGTSLGIRTATFMPTMPELYLVTVQDSNTLIAEFNEDMLNNAALTLPANYVITYAAATVPLGYAINFNSGTEVDVTFTRDMDINADLCTATKYAIAFVPGTTPLTYAIAMPSATEIDVTFNKGMHIDTVLIDPTKYSIAFVPGTTPLTYTVLVISPTEIDITFNKDMHIDTVLINPAKYSITL